MTIAKMIQVFCVGLAVAGLSACASNAAADPAAAKSSTPATAPANSPTAGAAIAEADTASAMERRFQEAARSYKTVEKDGKTMYCKREKLIGTTIPTMNCITEAQLRNQVESMEDYRNRARNAAKCTHGPGCAGGG
jgi:hypothetical protein